MGLDTVLLDVLRRVPAGAVLTGLLLAGTATSAFAVPPERETFTIAETFHDEFLSAACGVDVTTTETGRVTVLTFPDRPVGPQDLVSIHLSFVAVAGDNSVQFQNLGVDLTRIEPDGTVVLVASGKAPFFFTGVLKINLTTGEVIHEPRHTLDTAQACLALTS